MRTADCWRVDLDESCWLDLHPNWIEDDAPLFRDLVDSTPWEQESITLFGQSVPQPRLTAWFGVGMDVRTRYRTTAPALAWPPDLARIVAELRDHTGIEFNSALANYYRDGNDSVGWHADDEPALGHDPVIASLSLGGSRRFRLRRRDKTATHEVALGAGDLLVMHGATQRLWLHTVPRTKTPQHPRVNLTFRRYSIGMTAGNARPRRDP